MTGSAEAKHPERDSVPARHSVMARTRAREVGKDSASRTATTRQPHPSRPRGRRTTGGTRTTRRRRAWCCEAVVSVPSVPPSGYGAIAPRTTIARIAVPSIPRGRAGAGPAGCRRRATRRPTRPSPRDPRRARSRGRRPRRRPGGTSSPRGPAPGRRRDRLRSAREHDLLQAGAMGGEHLLLHATDQAHLAWSVTSPVIPTSARTGRPLSNDASASSSRRRRSARPWAPRPPGRARGTAP